MKKSFILISVLLGASLWLSAQIKFQVRGNFSDTAESGDKVTLNYFNGEKKVYSSATIKDGAFSFEGTVKEPTKAVLTFNSSKKMRDDVSSLVYKKMAFYVEGGDVSIEGSSMKDAVIKAPGKAQKEYQVLEKQLEPFEEQDQVSFINMLKASVARDTMAVNRYKAINEGVKRQLDSIEVAYMKTHPNSHVSLGILSERVNAKTLADEKEKLSAWYQALAAPLKETIVGKKLGGQIALAFKMGPGNPAEDFVLNDTLGNPVHLSAFKGKYVLLDFWASWCIPCRAENPVVKKAYEKFKDKNFTVLGVSLEKPGDRKAWVEAIQKDGLTWTQVATLTKEENSMVSNLYGIQSIPMNFLIDPQGKIVATYLRGEALLKKLEEIL